MDDRKEFYRVTAEATVAAIKRWKQQHPEAQPMLPAPGKSPLLGDIRLGPKYYELDEMSLDLIRYCTMEVQHVTWLMFYGAWEKVYAS